MQRDHRVGLGARRDDRIPVVALPQRRQADRVRSFRERDRRKPRAALRRISSAAARGVGEIRDAERHDRVGMRLVPLLEQPVVPRPDAREPELGVGRAGEHAAAEPGDLRREVHRRPHAVDVHVAHAGVDVVTAGPHLVEAERLDLHALRAPAGHRVHADLPVALSFELPDLMAPARLDDPRRAILQRGRSRPSNGAAARRRGRRPRSRCTSPPAVRAPGETGRRRVPRPSMAFDAHRAHHYICPVTAAIHFDAVNYFRSARLVGTVPVLGLPARLSPPSSADRITACSWYRRRRGRGGVPRPGDVLVVQRGERPVRRWPVPLVGDDISDIIEQPLDGLPFSDQLPTFDRRAHRAPRPVDAPVAPKRLKENEEFMWRLADRQLDEIQGKVDCEFISEYAQPFTLSSSPTCSACPRKTTTFRPARTNPWASAARTDRAQTVGVPLRPVHAHRGSSARPPRRRNDRLGHRDLPRRNDPRRPRRRPDRGQPVRRGPGDDRRGSFVRAAVHRRASRSPATAPRRPGRIPNFLEETLRLESRSRVSSGSRGTHERRRCRDPRGQHRAGAPGRGRP